MNNAPVCVFDSGAGGLTVWKEIVELLPGENVTYLSDSANCPYGHKTHKEIYGLSKRIVDFFLLKKAKLIVIACNTATAAAIKELRQNYSIPFVGMEPAVKPAALSTKTGNIGILATEGTFKGEHFINTSSKYRDGVKIHEQIGYGLVELVEEGKSDSKEASVLLSKYLRPMLENNSDHIVLGCTHYPLLQEQIRKITKGKAKIVNPAGAVAQQVKRVLETKSLLNTSGEAVNHEFYTTGNIEKFRNVLKAISSHTWIITPLKI